MVRRHGHTFHEPSFSIIWFHATSLDYVSFLQNYKGVGINGTQVSMVAQIFYSMVPFHLCERTSDIFMKTNIFFKKSKYNISEHQTRKREKGRPFQKTRSLRVFNHKPCFSQAPSSKSPVLAISFKKVHQIINHLVKFLWFLTNKGSTSVLKNFS